MKGTETMTMTEGRDWSEAAERLRAARAAQVFPTVTVPHIRLARAMAMARDLGGHGWLTHPELQLASRIAPQTGCRKVNELAGLLACHAPEWTVRRRKNPEFAMEGGRRAGALWQYRIERGAPRGGKDE